MNGGVDQWNFSKVTSMQTKHSMHAGNLTGVPITNVLVEHIGSIRNLVNFINVTLASVSFGRIRRRQDSISRLSKFQRLNVLLCF